MDWHGLAWCETTRASVTSVDLPRLVSKNRIPNAIAVQAHEAGLWSLGRMMWKNVVLFECM